MSHYTRSSASKLGLRELDLGLAHREMSQLHEASSPSGGRPAAAAFFFVVAGFLLAASSARRSATWRWSASICASFAASWRACSSPSAPLPAASGAAARAAVLHGPFEQYRLFGPRHVEAVVAPHSRQESPSGWAFSPGL